MNKETRYSNREINHMFKEQTDELKLFFEQTIEPLTTQVTYTNSKVRRITLALVVIGSVVGTLLVVNGSKFLDFVKSIII